MFSDEETARSCSTYAYDALTCMYDCSTDYTFFGYKFTGAGGPRSIL